MAWFGVPFLLLSVVPFMAAESVPASVLVAFLPWILDDLDNGSRGLFANRSGKVLRLTGVKVFDELYCDIVYA